MNKKREWARGMDRKRDWARGIDRKRSGPIGMDRKRDYSRIEECIRKRTGPQE
jgi:hypothetical protein